MKLSILTLALFFFLSVSLNSQESSDTNNSTEKPGKLSIGGYSHVDYSKPLNSSIRSNGVLDVYRLVLAVGYSFSDKTSFFSEVEFEHVKELYVEQAYINHAFSEALNLKAGLMIIPVGIINEYHEPPAFNGVSRPSVDNIIIPTTWREIGVGFTGRLSNLNLKYQAYLVNGFLGYSGNKGLIGGSKFLRDARQKGAKSIMNSPNLALRLDYFGIPSLKLGVSGYFGKTASTLNNSIDKSDIAAIARADSSVTGLSMIEADFRYNVKGFGFRGQYVYASLSNSAAYNMFTGNDAPSGVNGYYFETSYDLSEVAGNGFRFTPFIRFEHYNTHLKTELPVVKQDKYNVNEIITGIGWRPVDQAVFKIDIQFRKSEADSDFIKTVNGGIGVWF